MPISVGIPAYNQGRYLGQCLESLLRQTVPPFEIVVSDNHSVDETPRIIAGFGNRVRALRPPQHLEAHPHFDFLVRQLRGEWFALLSSDDIAKPEYVETLHRGARRSARAVLVRADYERIDAEGVVRETIQLRGAERIVSPPETFFEHLLRPRVSFAAFAARRSAWERAGGFGNEIALLGDWAFWLKLALHGDFVYEPRIISQYRYAYRPGLERARLLSRLGDEVSLHRRLIPRLAAHIDAPDDGRLAVASRARCYLLMAEASQLLGPHERQEAAGILAPWAMETGCGKDLDRFRGGAILPRRKGLLRRIRRALKSACAGRLAR